MAADAPASVVNSATVSGGGDPTPATDNDPTTIEPETLDVNLSIEKSHTGDFAQGEIGATYSIVVSNDGPDATAGLVTVTDTLPTGLTATAITGSGWNCVLATLTCTRSNTLSVGNDYPTITLTVDVAADAPASVVQRATVTGGGDPDPTPVDDPTTIIPSDLTADLALTKSAPATAKVGDQFAYTMVVENKGPATATDVEIADPLPTGLTFVSSADCNAVMVCNLGSIASGDSRTVEVTVEATDVTAGTTVVNTAVVNAEEFDPNPDDNTATAETDIDPLSDLKVTKTGPASIQAGSTIGWEILVENAGPSAAEDVEMDDPLPAGLTNPTVTTEQGTCDLTVSCSLGTIPANGSVLVLIEADIPADAVVGSTVSNTVTVTTTTDDKDPDDNTSTSTTTVSPPTPGKAEIAITKKLSNQKVTLGDIVTFKLTARNSGDAAAKNVVIKDTLSSKLKYVSSKIPGGNCSVQGATVTCKVSKLAAGKSVTATIKARAIEPGQVANTGTIQADDSKITKRKSTIKFPVDKGQTKIGIVKTALRKKTRDGSRVSFRIEITNLTNQAATDVEICDILPGKTTIIRSKEGRKMSGGKLCWTIDYLPGGAVRGAWVTLRVDNFTSLDELTNIGTVTAGNTKGKKKSSAKVKLVQRTSSARGGGVTG